MAKDDLKKLLIQLFGDPDLRRKIEAEGWSGFGLSEEEIALLNERDHSKISAYLGADAAKLIIVTHWLPPTK